MFGTDTSLHICSDILLSIISDAPDYKCTALFDVKNLTISNFSTKASHFRNCEYHIRLSPHYKIRREFLTLQMYFVDFHLKNANESVTIYTDKQWNGTYTGSSLQGKMFSAGQLLGIHILTDGLHFSGFTVSYRMQEISGRSKYLAR